MAGLAAAAVRACQETRSDWARRLLTGGVAAGVLWTGGAALVVWPHGLCYVNELWGGTRDGYLRVSETNYDWGQGLKELRRWQRRQGLAALDVWYFGTDPAVNRPPFRLVGLHALPIQGPQDVRAQVCGPYLAVSTTLLYGAATNLESHQRAAAFLRSLRPVDRTTTFLIYDVAAATSAGQADNTALASGR
jgi:hypothetical protein